MTSESKVQTRAAQADQSASSLIADKTLLKIYTSMLQCQLLQAHLRRLRGGQRKMSGPVPEHAAILAAMTADLKEYDILSLPARDAAAGFLKGQPLSSILRPEASKRKVVFLHSAQPERLLAGNVVPAARDTLGQLYLACGLALARAQAAHESVVATFCAGPPVDASCWKEVLTLASQNRLPMIVVVHDTSRRIRPFDTITRSARVHGVPLLITDSRDAVAVYRVVYESLSRARKGLGPTLVSCRTAIQNTAPHENHGLHRMEMFLRHKGILDAKLRDQLIRRFRALLRTASKGGSVSVRN